MSTITTSADLQTYMNRTLVAGVASDVVNAVNDWVESETHRCWGETKQVTEKYSWDSVVWLRHCDLVSVDEVQLGWPGQTQGVVDPSAYFSDEFGRLTFYMYANPNMSRLYNDYLQIKYTYGVATAPNDLKLAALGIAAGFYNWATNNQKDIVASQVGSYRLEYAGRVRSGTNGPDPANNTNDANWRTISRYAMKRV